MKTIGARIKELRRERNLNQEVVAEALGISKATVSKIEAGNVKPSLKRIGALAKIFEITIPELLDEPVATIDIGKTRVRLLSGKEGYIDGYGTDQKGNPCVFVAVPMLRKIVTLSIDEVTIIK